MSEAMLAEATDYTRPSCFWGKQGKFQSRLVTLPPWTVWSESHYRIFHLVNITVTKKKKKKLTILPSALFIPSRLKLPIHHDFFFYKGGESFSSSELIERLMDKTEKPERPSLNLPTVRVLVTSYFSSLPRIIENVSSFVNTIYSPETCRRGRFGVTLCNGANIYGAAALLTGP